MDEKKWWFLAVGIIALSLVCFSGCEKIKGPAPSVSKDVVATVNKHTITMEEVNTRIGRMPAQYREAFGKRKKEIVDDIVLEYLLYDEATQKGIENEKEVKNILEDTKKRVLIAKLLSEEIEKKGTVSEKEIEEYYNANKEKYAVSERWRASHILVKTEDDAKAVLKELSKGRPFEEIAKEKSQDTTAKNGGELGYFAKNQLVPAFEETATKLKIGEVSGVVKTEFGYHIIKLTDYKPAQLAELKDVKPRIQNELLSQKRKELFESYIADLKKRASVKINEEMLIPAPEVPPETQPEPVTPEPVANE